MGFVQEKLPVQSGRDFRVQAMTDDQLYDMYRKSTNNALGKSTFVTKVLNSFKIHHATAPASCPYCIGIANTKSKGFGEGLDFHKQIAITQQSEYLKMKNQCWL